MTFGAPLWLLGLLAALPALVLLYAWSGQRVRRRLHRFAAGKLAAALTANHSPRRQRFKLALVLLAVALLFGALARPQWGVVLEESEARGIDLMIALDTSRSMLAEDVRPNRLERAKLAVLDLAQQMRGDRVGLIAFAGEAFLQCPLTLDYDAFRATLAATVSDDGKPDGTLTVT
ncbi:MAG: VWA domain-containing protein, partial [Verrucomicrobiota bacterium]